MLESVHIILLIYNYNQYNVSGDTVHHKHIHSGGPPIDLIRSESLSFNFSIDLIVSTFYNVIIIIIPNLFLLLTYILQFSLCPNKYYYVKCICMNLKLLLFLTLMDYSPLSKRGQIMKFSCL